MKRKYEVVMGFEVESEDYMELSIATGLAAKKAANEIELTDSNTILNVMGISVNPKKDEVKK